ncbi:MAG: hypothetical protein ACRDVM_03120 [Acidimicrobiia bacterium]
MRFSVEPWAPEYGAAVAGELGQPEPNSEVDVEVPVDEWAPIDPAGEPAATVLFVDGVQRVHGRVWIDQPDGTAALGLCAGYAAGAVRCDGRSVVVAAEVRSGLFTAATGAEPILTRHGRYEVRATAGSTPEDLWLGLQQRMGELEKEVAAGHGPAGLVVVDGPLSHRQHIPGAVGYVKTHRVHYLPVALQPVLGRLLPGQRTPVFLTTTTWSRYSWYLRLAGPAEHPFAGVVRAEVSADQEASSARRLADRIAVTLPRFASAPHKDPRAPQNLYPIGGLERELRHRLGDPLVLYRDLREAAAGGSQAAERVARPALDAGAE